MYIEKAETYYCGTEQRTRRDKFLILMQPDDEKPVRNNIRGIVRKVALRQCGHWMMGKVRIGSKSFTVSGAYGADGLILTVDRKTWEMGTPLPNDLYDRWAKGGGWNSCGNEAPAMQEWAKTI